MHMVAWRSRKNFWSKAYYKVKAWKKENKWEVELSIELSKRHRINTFWWWPVCDVEERYWELDVYHDDDTTQYSCDCQDIGGTCTLSKKNKLNEHHTPLQYQKLTEDF